MWSDGTLAFSYKYAHMGQPPVEFLTAVVEQFPDGSLKSLASEQPARNSYGGGVSYLTFSNDGSGNPFFLLAGICENGFCLPEWSVNIPIP
jgi:hypothetical protein